MTNPQGLPQSTPAPVVGTPPAPPAPAETEKERKFWQRPIFLIVILILIIGGVVLGLAIRSQRQPSPPTSRWPQISPAPQALILSIESPQNEVVVVDDKALVKGKTLPKTTVMIYSDTDETSTESDENGNFQGEITLVTGINTLTITAFGENGQEKTATLDVVYDKET